MIAKEFLDERSDHHIRFLFKSFLEVLEDLKSHHDINFNKLYDSLPDDYEELINMSDYFDEEYFSKYRKKVLDLGNSVLRDYNSELDTLHVEFRFKQ
jgi:hypothetical protein